MLLGIVSVQFGAAIAKHLFGALGKKGAVSLRIFLAADVLVVWWRPLLRLDRKAWKAVIGYRLVLGLKNRCFDQALACIPLGIAMSIEFLGPLGVALLPKRAGR